MSTEVRLNGQFYSQMSECQEWLKPNCEVRLEREEQNPYDNNAVLVLFDAPNGSTYKIGYVERGAAPVIGAIISRAVAVSAVLHYNERTPEKFRAYMIEIFFE